MSEAMKSKSESLAEKMNKITAKFDLADELLVDGDDIIEDIQEKQHDIELYKSELDITETDVINLQAMTDDFVFARDTLRENAENGRKVLNVITLDLLDSDDEKRAALILSFAELNKAVTDNIKLYMQSWKEMSAILLNIDKIKKTQSPKTVNNTINVTGEAINTADLLEKLRNKK